MSADDAGTPQPLVQTAFNEAQAQFSPDGRWIAYAADETRSGFDVYIRDARATAKRWRVSLDGGWDPHWSADGSELFYVAADGYLTSVSVAQSGEPGVPVRLFHMPEIPVVPPYLSAYDVTRDGRRFLVRLPIEDVHTRPLTVVMNGDWTTSTGREH